MIVSEILLSTCIIWIDEMTSKSRLETVLHTNELLDTRTSIVQRGFSYRSDTGERCNRLVNRIVILKNSSFLLRPTREARPGYSLYNVFVFHSLLSLWIRGDILLSCSLCFMDQTIVENRCNNRREHYFNGEPFSVSFVSEEVIVVLY